MVETGKSGATCEAYMGSLERYHALALGVVIRRSPRVRMAVQGSKVVTPPPRAKPVFGGQQLKTLLRPLSVHVFDELVLRTALVFSFATGVRVSNYASGGTYVRTKHVLRWRDLGVRAVGSTPVQHSTVRSTKSMRPNAAAPVTLTMGPVATDELMCPVALFKRLKRHARRRGLYEPGAPVFRLADGSVLRASAVNRFLRMRAPAIGLPPKALTSHSFRRAFATAGKRAGADVRTLLRQGMWKVKSTNAVAEELYLKDGSEVFRHLTAKMMETSFMDFERVQVAQRRRRQRSWV